MKINSILTFVLCLLSAILYSQENASHLSSNTFFSLTINGNNLQTKMSIEDIEALDIYSEFKKELEQAGLSGKLNEMGIDLNKELTIFSSFEGDYLIFGIMVPIKDSTPFKKLTSLENAEIQNGISFEDTFGIIRGMNDQYFILASSQPKILYPSWESTEAEKEKFNNIQENKSSFLQDYILNLFQTNSSPLSKTDRYKKSYDENADINYYISIDADLMEYYSNNFSRRIIGESSIGNLISKSAPYEDQYYAGELFFNSNEVTINSEYFPNKKNFEIHKKVAQSSLNPKLLKYVSNEDLLGLYNINLNTEEALLAAPELIAPIMSSISPLADNAEKKIMSLFSSIIDEEAVGKIINGNGIISVSNFSPKEISYTTYDYDDEFNMIEKTETKTESLPDVLGIFSTSDPDQIANILDLSTIDSPLEKRDGYYFLPSSREIIFPIYLFVTNDALFVSNSQKQMQLIKNSKGYDSISPELAKNILNNSQNLFIDLGKIFSVIPRTGKPDNKENQVLNYLTKNTRTINFHQYKPKGKSVRSELIIETPDSGNQNSLNYLFNLINDLYKIAENK